MVTSQLNQQQFAFTGDLFCPLMQTGLSCSSQRSVSNEIRVFHVAERIWELGRLRRRSQTVDSSQFLDVERQTRCVQVNF
jgi:hypothetical protein